MTTTVTDRATFGYALAHDEGETFWFAGMLQTVKIGSADTGGRYGLIEFLVPPGLGSPWHVHTDEDEWFYVLDGNLTVYVGDTRVDLAPGGALSARRASRIRSSVLVPIRRACSWASRRYSSRDSCGKLVGRRPRASCRRVRRAHRPTLSALHRLRSAMGSSSSARRDRRLDARGTRRADHAPPGTPQTPNIASSISRESCRGTTRISASRGRRSAR